MCGAQLFSPVACKQAVQVGVVDHLHCYVTRSAFVRGAEIGTAGAVQEPREGETERRDRGKGKEREREREYRVCVRLRGL